MDIDAQPSGAAVIGRRPLLLAALVFVLGLAFSAAGSKLLYDAALQRERAHLEEEASAKARQLELAIELALESLISVKAFFDAGSAADDAQFAAFARSDATRHRGTLALGWVPQVAHEGRADFEAALSERLGRPAVIFEATGHGMRRAAGERARYYPLQYLASLGGGDFEPGLDLASVSSRREAILAALAGGRPGATKARRSDVWGSGGEQVVQAFMPVYREGAAGPKAGGEVAGLSVGVFSVSEIFRRVFDAGSEGFELALFDLSAPTPEQRLFALHRDDGARSAAEFRALLARTGPAVERRFLFADREWVAYFLPRAGSASLATFLWPFAGLLAGLLLTSLLAVYLFAALARGKQLFWLNRRLDGVQQRLLEAQVASAVQRNLREQALSAAQARSSFLQAASHDLRQPLHALTLYLSVLADEPDAARDPAFAARLQNTAGALQGLFDALLDIGRLESGRLEPQPRPFELRPLLARLCEEAAGLAQRKSLRLLQRLEPVSVVSDPLLLERVVRNLLFNALRYTASGWIALRCVRRGGVVRLQVFDSGPGIPAARRDRVFEPYVRGSREGEGIGLGLAIVRELARLLGHPLAMRSRFGRGSVFTLELPAAAAVAPPFGARAPGHGDAALHGESALVVDDDAEVREATAARLRAWGAQVRSAGTLAEARAALAGAGPALTLCLVDQHLPDGLGSELLRELKSAGVRPAAVLITGDAASDAALAGGDAGLIVLRKPITPLKLRSALGVALQRARQAQRAEGTPSEHAA